MFGFLNFLFNDQSSEWKECVKVPLSLNLYNKSVNNAAIGDAYEKLQTFGRPNNRRPFKTNQFNYFLLGMDVRGADGKINSFHFTVRRNEELFDEGVNEEHYIPCELSVINKNGGHLLINPHTSPADIERFLGVPTEKDEDVDFLSLIYESGEIALDFTFGEKHLLYDVYFGV